MSKKIFTLLIAVLAFATTAHTQQVEAVQRTVLTKRTATWCPNCGSYGWTLMENIIADNADKAVIIAAHENGSSLQTQTAEDITANWGSFGQPSFFVNEVNQSVNSSNIAAKRTAIKDQVDAAFGTQPVANVGFEPVYVDGAIKVDAKVQFFQAAQGEFFLSIYLLEDNVEASQAGSVSDGIHDRVLRYNFSDFSWGKALVNGNVSANQEFQESFSLLIGNPAGYEYHVVGIIWRLDNGKYIPVNTWSTTNIETPLAAEEVANLTRFDVQPTVVSNAANVMLELTDSQPIAVIELFDLTGRKVATVFDGLLSAGDHIFSISREMTGGNGSFIVRFTDGKRVSSQRVIFQ